MRRSRPQPAAADRRVDEFAKGDLVTGVINPRVYRVTGLVVDSDGLLPAMVQLVSAYPGLGNLFEPLEPPCWKPAGQLRKVRQLGDTPPEATP